MSFFRRKNIQANRAAPEVKKHPKRKIWKVLFLILGSLLVVGIAYGAFLFSTGAKIFDRGIDAGSFLRSLSGKGTTLKGESDGRVNILLLGMGGPNHPGGFLSDSMMVVSIKTDTKQIAMVSLPRDLQVPISGHGDDKINSAYADGYNDYVSKNCKKKNSNCTDSARAAGATLASKTVSDITGLPIDYYVTVEFSGFEKIIDQLGGVDVNVDKAIYDPLFPDESMQGYAPLRLKAGLQHLNGSTALKYARSRETTSDFDRAARQQKILEAIRERASNVGVLTNPKKLSDLIGALSDSVRTNFTPAEINALLAMVKDVSSSDIINKVLSDAPEGLLVSHNNGTYYLVPKSGNFSDIKALFNKIFIVTNGETCSIEVLNGSKTAGLATRASDLLAEKTDCKVDSVKVAETAYSNTTIIDYTGSKPNSLASIKKVLGHDLVSKGTTSKKDVDFTIIIGDDYK